MIEVRKKFITNGTNFPARVMSRFRSLASFYGVPEFYFPNVKEYLDAREAMEDKTFVNLRFLDINSKTGERFLVGDSTGEFEVRIPIDFVTRGLLNMGGHEIPTFKEDMRLYDILLNKSDRKGDVIECFGLKPSERRSYYDSDEEYLSSRYAIHFNHHQQ